MHDARVARRDVRCGNARYLVVARQDLCGGKEQGRRPSAASTKGGGRLRRPPPFVVPLFLATTEVLSCHNEHPVLPQRTSRLATQEIRRASQDVESH